VAVRAARSLLDPLRYQVIYFPICRWILLDARVGARGRLGRVPADWTSFIQVNAG